MELDLKLIEKLIYLGAEERAAQEEIQHAQDKIDRIYRERRQERYREVCGVDPATPERFVRLSDGRVARVRYHPTYESHEAYVSAEVIQIETPALAHDEKPRG